MHKAGKKKARQWWVWALILLIALVILGGGYGLYYQSIERAVYYMTFSFIQQLADHDHLNIVNQIDSKGEYLRSLLSRIEVTRDSRIEEVVYSLGVETQATSFDTLYLITTEDEVYSSSFFKSPLQNMSWGKTSRIPTAVL